MNVHSHYENLKVTRDAPPEVVRAAYKVLAQNLHPDKNPRPEAAEYMKLINAAYAVLSDIPARLRYDEWLAAEEMRWTFQHPTITPQRPAAAPAPTAPPSAAPMHSNGTFEIDDELFRQGVAKAESMRKRSFKEVFVSIVMPGAQRVFKPNYFG